MGLSDFQAGAGEHYQIASTAHLATDYHHATGSAPSIWKLGNGWWSDSNVAVLNERQIPTVYRANTTGA